MWGQEDRLTYRTPGKQNPRTTQLSTRGNAVELGPSWKWGKFFQPSSAPDWLD